MKFIVAIFIFALALAPVLSVQPKTWPGSYSHYQLPNDRVGALLLAWNADPQPSNPTINPDDSWWCLGNPQLPMCQHTQ